MSRPVVSDFVQLTDLHLVRYRDSVLLAPRMFYLSKDFVVSFFLDKEKTTYTCPAGMGTDFASVPQIAQNIVPAVGLYGEAAVVHDHLCIVKGPWSSKTAADVLQAGMIAAGVPGWQVELIWKMVLEFGPQWKGQDET